MTDALTRMIARLQTQRACLAAAAAAIADLPGPVLELGLGKGRTCDWLRHHLPDRDIHVFDRSVHAPAALVPRHVHLGDFRDSLPAFVRHHGPVRAALVHGDIGSADPVRDAALTAALPALLSPTMRPGAWLVTDRAMPAGPWEPQPLPAGARGWPYFMYKMI